MGPVLHTERTVLRPLGPDAMATLHAMWANPHVRRYLWDDVVIEPAVAGRVLETSAADFAQHAYGLWGVFTRATDELIGFCGLRSGGPEPELLYGLLPQWCGQGLASEAARAVLDYAFADLKLRAIVAATDRPNVASIRVLERLGMEQTREERVDGRPTIYFRIHAR